jgi:hypothetical protein
MQYKGVTQRRCHEKLMLVTKEKIKPYAILNFIPRKGRWRGALWP